MFVSLLLLACVDTEPTHVEKRDLDMALSRGDQTTLCAGLKMKDPDVRELAARHLTEYGGGSDCLCERDVYEGHWDAAVLQGVKDSTDDKKVACLGKLLDDPAAPDRDQLVQALFAIKAPAIQARLKTAAVSDADPKIRAYALASFGDSKDPADRQMLLDGLTSNTDPLWRASAASALTNVPEAIDGLRKAATSDTDPGVRAAALTALKSTKGVEFTPLGCAALQDAAPAPRAAAALAFRATTDPAALACLRDAMLVEQTDGSVRAALLKTLRGSPAPEAGQILCDAIPFWISTYAKDAEPPREGDTDILFAQNDRDFEHSAACVARARKQAGGWSCWGKSYASEWAYHLGGPRHDINCTPQ